MMERRNRTPPTNENGDPTAEDAQSLRRAARARARLKPLESGSEDVRRSKNGTGSERKRSGRERRTRVRRGDREKDEVDEVLDGIIGDVSGDSEAEERRSRSKLRAEQRKPSRLSKVQSSTPRDGGATERNDVGDHEARSPALKSPNWATKEPREASRRSRKDPLKSPDRVANDPLASPKRRKDDTSASPVRQRDRPSRSPTKQRNGLTGPLPELGSNASTPSAVPRFMSRLGNTSNPQNPQTSPKHRPPKLGGASTPKMATEKGLRLPRLVAPGTSTPRSVAGSETGTMTPASGLVEHPAAKALRVGRANSHFNQQK